MLKKNCFQLCINASNTIEKVDITIALQVIIIIILIIIITILIIIIANFFYFKIGKLHEKLPLHVSFVVLSGRTSFDEIAAQMKLTSRIFALLNPHVCAYKRNNNQQLVKDDNYHLLDLIKQITYLSYKSSTEHALLNFD